MPDITPEESILIQSLALAECYVNLGQLEVERNPLISENVDSIFGSTGKTMTKLGHSVFQGQGTLISVFYMFLVLPHEWEKKGKDAFKNLDLAKPKAVAQAKAEVELDYADENYGALRHFRNALAHGRIYGRNDRKLVIEDKRGNERYRAVYSMESLGELADCLYNTIKSHLDSVMLQRS